MFEDNLLVVNSSTMPGGKLLKRNNILNYHRVRETQAIGIINFVHMKSLIFWHAREVPQVEESVESSTYCNIQYRCTAYYPTELTRTVLRSRRVL
jgi:hypothetical protein